MNCQHEAVFPVAGKDLDGPLPGELGVCASCLAVLRFGEDHTTSMVSAPEIAHNQAVHEVVGYASRLKQQREQSG